MNKAMPNAHDLLAAEQFLAAETRIAGLFERTEEAIAPLLRNMRATGRTTYVTDPERGVIWGHAFLRPPYAPSAEAEWFVGWGLRFPDGGSGWDGADPRLPTVPHVIVAIGASAPQTGLPRPSMRILQAQGWSSLSGDAAFAAAVRTLGEMPAEPEALVAAVAQWTTERVGELRSLLPSIAGP